MPIIRSAEATAHDLHGATFTAYANSKTGAAELCAWRTRVPAGQPGLPHRISKEEIFIVTTGTARVTIDGEPLNAQPGDVVVAPAGSLISIEVLEDKDCDHLGYDKPWIDRAAPGRLRDRPALGPVIHSIFRFVYTPAITPHHALARGLDHALDQGFLDQGPSEDPKQ